MPTTNVMVPNMKKRIDRMYSLLIIGCRHLGEDTDPHLFEDDKLIRLFAISVGRMSLNWK